MTRKQLNNVIVAQQMEIDSLKKELGEKNLLLSSTEETLEILRNKIVVLEGELAKKNTVTEQPIVESSWSLLSWWK